MYCRTDIKWAPNIVSYSHVLLNVYKTRESISFETEAALQIVENMVANHLSMIQVICAHFLFQFMWNVFVLNVIVRSRTCCLYSSFVYWFWPRSISSTPRTLTALTIQVICYIQFPWSYSLLQWIVFHLFERQWRRTRKTYRWPQCRTDAESYGGPP